jgi:Ser/Thr protein kinase RdoA (MazF antagonist)
VPARVSGAWTPVYYLKDPLVIPDADLQTLLAARGIQPRSVSKLTAGQKNRTFLVTTAAEDQYVVRQYATATAAEADYELTAAEYLSARGFPTPAPIRTADDTLAGHIGSRPAAVFKFVTGNHPADLGTVPRDDLELGLQSAALAGRIHRLTWGVTFPGHRTDQLDPLRRINRFLEGPMAAMPALAQVTDPLARLSVALTGLYAASPIPRGLVHNDISAHNLLLNPAGSVAALIDFDDCMTSFLLYDLGRIVEVWGSGPGGHIDQSRVDQLIDAYSRERTLTIQEKRLAISLIAAYAAATGIGVLANKLRHGHTITSPADSVAMSVALQLLQRSDSAKF